MKKYTVITTVQTQKGELHVGDPVVLDEKELEEITKTVNQRHAIRITTTKGSQINQKFFPLTSLNFIEVKAKEIEEIHA